MSYKTILVHIDNSRHTPSRVRLAADIAVKEGAHLIGAAMTGVSRFLYQSSGVDLSRTVLAGHIDELEQRARKVLEQFETIAKTAGVESVETRLINDSEHEALCLQARYSDLVVLGQTDRDELSSPMLADLPQYVVLNSRRPVLIVPHSGIYDTAGANALVAWDGGMEATRAITDAMPLLLRARSVTLALFNPEDRKEAHGEEPGADMGLFLARHGVRVEVVQRITSNDVGEALLSLAADLGSDLIVMGGYGHARFREILLGGVTETVLESMTRPVLMSH